MRHYIEMSGLRGCLPDNVNVHSDRDSAVDSLVSLFELGKTRERILDKTGWLDLNPKRDGAEYAEVSSCDCASPWDHSDYYQTPEAFMREYPEMFRGDGN